VLDVIAQDPVEVGYPLERGVHELPLLLGQRDLLFKYLERNGDLGECIPEGMLNSVSR
jgi:hypothetical protein